MYKLRTASDENTWHNHAFKKCSMYIIILHKPCWHFKSHICAAIVKIIHCENHPSCSDSKPQWLQVWRRAQLKPQSIYLLDKAKAGLVTSHLWKIMNTAVEKNTFTERTTEVSYKRNIEMTPAFILLLFSSQERKHDLIKFITWGSK